MKIQIKDWAKFQGRKGLENPRWFSVPKELFTDPKLMGKLKPGMIAALCYVCAQALGDDEGCAEINPTHMAAYTGLNSEEIISSLEELERIQLVHIRDHGVYTSCTRVCTTSTIQDNTRHDSTRVYTACASDESDAPQQTKLENKTQQVIDLIDSGLKKLEPELKKLSESSYEEVDADFTEILPERKYVPEEELIPRKPKKERKPKPELPCDPIPELISIQEILESRKISSLLQRRLVQSYGERKVIFEIRKAENWLIAKNEVKKNYGAFFSNWIARSWRAESLPANQLPNDPPRNSQPEKPVSALEQRSEGFREQIRRKNLGLPNTIDGSYIPGVSE